MRTSLCDTVFAIALYQIYARRTHRRLAPNFNATPISMRHEFWKQALAQYIRSTPSARTSVKHVAQRAPPLH